MQKAKKMSKQTLVIAVLAVLLVLSLALTVTGAWFTDTAQKSSETTIEFATVAISDATLAANETGHDVQTGVFKNVLPGDTIALEGKVSTDATVDIYVAIKLSDVTLKGTDGTTEYDLTKVIDDTHYALNAAEVGEILDADDGEIDVVASTAAEEEVAAAKIVQYDADGYALYLVRVAAGDVTINYAGSVEFKGALENLYTVADGDYAGKTFVLNDNGQAEADENIDDENIVKITSVTIGASVNVAAIQADNINLEGTDGARELLEDMLTA